MATKKGIEKRKARNLDEMARRIELICKKLGIEDGEVSEVESAQDAGKPEGEPESAPQDGQPKARKDRK